MDIKNWNQITMTGPTEEDYRRYDQVVGEIIGHILDAVNEDGILRLQMFDRKNKEHMLVFHIAQMMSSIYDYKLELDCSWWDRIIINHKFRKIFNKVGKAPEYSLDGVWVDEMLDLIHVKLNYTFNFAEVYETYYERRTK